MEQKFRQVLNFLYLQDTRESHLSAAQWRALRWFSGSGFLRFRFQSLGEINICFKKYHNVMLKWKPKIRIEKMQFPKYSRDSASFDSKLIFFKLLFLKFDLFPETDVFDGRLGGRIVWISRSRSDESWRFFKRFSTFNNKLNFFNKKIIDKIYLGRRWRVASKKTKVVS